MRRFAWLATGLAFALVTGCTNLADRGLAARVDDWTLSEERLAELIVLAQPFPLDSAAAHELADHWMAAAALSLRSAAGDSLSGSEALAESTWLEQREAMLARDREQRLGAVVLPDDAEVEGTFRQGTLRLIAHVLRRVGPETSSSERLLQQRTAERLLSTLVEGGSWDQLVAESEDAASRQAGGLLGLFGPGELPATLDRTAFRLEPGQVSGVTQSADGYHILYRPRFEEVGSLYASRLYQRRLIDADMSAAESDRTARGFALTAGAATVVGAMVTDPSEWLESQQPLATWGAEPDEAEQAGAAEAAGSLTAGTVARYMFFLPPESLSQLAEADPEARTRFVRDLGTRELRLADAVARGLALDPAAAQDYARLHADDVEYWTNALELDGPDAPSRAALARHMESLVSRREEARSLPPLLEAWLLGRTESRVRARGVLAAIVLARGMLTEAGGATGTDP
ncbi:MAG: peptidylprolyl isomerase [Gemmatimonadetes bacterium]|nr:peptidylprolyl isomerase [Gemmatimonadota bacterium]